MRPHNPIKIEGSVYDNSIEYIGNRNSWHISNSCRNDLWRFSDDSAELSFGIQNNSMIFAHIFMIFLNNIISSLALNIYSKNSLVCAMISDWLAFDNLFSEMNAL